MKRCHNCAVETELTKLVRIVAIGRTDNHYSEVCRTCAIDLCDRPNAEFKRADQQPQAELT